MRTYGRTKNGLLKKISIFFEKTFLQKKLNNWVGILLVALVSLIFGFLIATKSVIGLGLLGVIFAIFVGLVCLISPMTGLYITAAFSFVAFFLSRRFFHEGLQVGAIFSALVFASFLGLLIKREGLGKQISLFYKNTMVVFMFLTLVFSGIQFFNPNSMSIDTNILAFRNFLGYIFVMFLAYALLDTREKIMRYLNYIFALSVLIAIYGCIQQWHGYFDFEMQLILADKHTFGLLFVGGELRKYSTMSDPSSFGILMAVCAVFYSIIAINSDNTRYRLILFGGILFMILAMGYSGTRTAYATALAGIGFYILLNFNQQRTRVFGIFAALTVLVLLFAPIGNRTVLRFRSTFLGTKDESYNVRVQAREFIRPYILSHPIGGGLGTTASKNHPGHYLAAFQPDSSYVKRAAETGWIGLIVIIVLYLICLWTCIKAFFATMNQEYRVLLAGCASAVYGFYIAEFAQGALGGLADSVVYYPLLAIVLKLRYIEFEKDKELEDSAHQTTMTTHQNHIQDATTEPAG